MMLHIWCCTYLSWSECLLYAITSWVCARKSERGKRLLEDMVGAREWCATEESLNIWRGLHHSKDRLSGQFLSWGGHRLQRTGLDHV